MKNNFTISLFTTIILFFLSNSFCNGQTTDDKENIDDDNLVYLIVDEMPEFPGGNKALFNTIRASLIYPKEVNKKVQGRVILSFIVGKQGNIEDIKIIVGLGDPFDSEAIRVVSSLSGKWKPGKQNGKLKRVQFTIPIEFKP